MTLLSKLIIIDIKSTLPEMHTSTNTRKCTTIYTNLFLLAMKMGIYITEKNPKIEGLRRR